MQPTDDDIFTTLAAIIGEALRIPTAQIERGSRLFHDFGAESIDIIDIRFRIEHGFGFKIDHEELIRSLGEGLSDSEIQEQMTVGRLVMYIKTRLQQPATRP